MKDKETLVIPNVARSAAEFRQRQSQWDAAALALERSMVAGVCLSLQEIMEKHPEFSMARMSIDSHGATQAYLFARADDGTVASLTDVAVYAIHGDRWPFETLAGQEKESFKAMGDRPWKAMAESSRDVFDLLERCSPSAAWRMGVAESELTGPDAASFARQMGEPEVAAELEKAQLESESKVGRCVSRKRGL